MWKILCLLFSFMFMFLFQFDFELSFSWGVNILFTVILACSIYYLYKKVKKINKGLLVNALLFSLFLQLGICFQLDNSITYLFLSFKNGLITILNIVSFTFLFYLLLNFFYDKFFKLNTNKPKKRIIQFIFYKHPFVSSFLIVLAVSLFYLIFFYPGTMAYDGLWQLDFYYGILEFNNHHPAILTLLMGGLMDLGRIILNDNLGMFLFILPQIVINALVYAYVLKVMNKVNTPFIIRLCSLAFYALFPLLVINSITYIKDTLFYLIFLFLFVYIYYHFRIDYKKSNKLKYVVIAILYFALYITRNTGFYIALIFSIIMVIFFLKKEKMVSLGNVLLAIFIILINFSYHHIFLEKLNIKEASVREMLSIPLQHTGRYLKYYSDDLSMKEKDVLNNMFRTNLKTIGKMYDPNRSDNVKWEFKEYPTDKELKDYFRVWGTMFLKHPLVYIDATLNNTYGYFYPNVVNFIGEDIGFYGIDVDGPVNTGEFSFKRNNLEWGRKMLYDFSLRFSKTPVLNLIYMPAFYVFILVSVSICLFKKKEVLIYLSPLYIVLLFCLISPVNGHMRYLQPILVCSPFLFAVLYKEIKERVFTKKNLIDKMGLGGQKWTH